MAYFELYINRAFSTAFIQIEGTNIATWVLWGVICYHLLIMNINIYINVSVLIGLHTSISLVFAVSEVFYARVISASNKEDLRRKGKAE